MLFVLEFLFPVRFIKPWGFNCRENLTGLKISENFQEPARLLKYTYIFPDFSFKKICKYAMLEDIFAKYLMN